MQLGLPFEVSTELSLASALPADISGGVEVDHGESPQPLSTATPPPLDFYFVRHRRARRYVVRVDVDGRVRVTIPRGGSRSEADAFARRHVDWIRRQQGKPRLPALPAAELRKLCTLARRLLPARLHELATDLGLTVSRVTIRNQRSRWGSCGRDGHICLNWRLVQMPDWVRDYVLVHELMHLRRMDHSPAYWRLVAAAYPQYQEARRWLRAHGRQLV
jgi:predicted metal-dependent hydrolase